MFIEDNVHYRPGIDSPALPTSKSSLKLPSLMTSEPMLLPPPVKPLLLLNNGVTMAVLARVPVSLRESSAT